MFRKIVASLVLSSFAVLPAAVAMDTKAPTHAPTPKVQKVSKTNKAKQSKNHHKHHKHHDSKLPK